MNSFQPDIPASNNGPGMVIIIAALLLVLLPFPCMDHFYGTINPFVLKGPEFLAFYAGLSIAAYAGACLLKQSEPSGSPSPLTGKVAAWIVTAVIILGILRLGRGVILGRPVGFLIMMLIAHACLFMRFFKGPDTK